MILASRAAASPAGALPYRWVGVGTNGFLSTSDSTLADSWTTRTSSFSTTQINSVKSNGENMWVAVGDAGKLATSPDGITWTQRTSSFSTTDIKIIQYGNGIWVAGGASSGGTPKFATATDPTGTWTQRTSGFASGDIQSITFGQGLWAAISSTGEIMTATDPTGTWTARTSTLTAATGYGWIRYCPDQSIWVAGFDTGTTGAVASSTDGLTWTSRNLATTAALGGGYFINNSSAIVAVFATTGTVIDIDSSTNGTSWTARTPARTSPLMGAPGVDGTGLMVIPSDTNFVQTSTDGTTWTSRTGPTTYCFSIQNSGGL